MFVFAAIIGNLKAEDSYERYLRCYRGAMDKVLCNDGYKILIHGAYFADNGPVTRCRDSSIPDKLCKEDIEINFPGYYAEILSKCNGYRACRNLIAQKARTSCNSFFNPKSDYVLLEYSCLPVTTIPPPTTSSTSTSTSHSTINTATTTQAKDSTNDSQMSTVSENTTGTLNGTEVYNNGSISVSGITDGKSTVNTAHQLDSMLAVKIALPLTLLILGVVAIFVILLLLKKRRKQVKSSDTSGAVFTNATYENSSTLQVRQNRDTGICNANGQTVNFNIYSNDSEIGRSPLATLQNGSLPAGTQSNSPYVDMASSKNKFRAWFKNRTSKLMLKKEQVPPACGLEPEPQPAEAIYAEPTEVCGTPRQCIDDMNGYSVQQSCNGLANPSSTILENSYTLSPVMVKSQPETSYISMNDSTTTANKMLGRPLPPTGSQTYDLCEHYSEIAPPTRPEDVEGIYSSPKNNQSVESQTDQNQSTNRAQSNISQNQTPLQLTYANIQPKSADQPQDEHDC